MSPESLKERIFSEKTDVWSFAVTCVEILTQMAPYKGMSLMVIASYCLLVDGTNFYREVLGNRLRPTAPDTDVPPEIANLIKDCSAFQPEDRPTFQQIVSRLQ